MDVNTVMLMLAIGSFLFGLLLVAFKHNKNNPQKVPYWILAKILQGIGFLLLYLRTDRFDFLTVPANLSLLSGCAYEAWAVRILLGQSIKRKVHLATLIVIIFACNLAYFLVAPYGVGVFFLLQSVFYFLPGFFLLGKSDLKFPMRMILGVCYFVTGSVFLIGSVVCFILPDIAMGLEGGIISAVIPGLSFCMFLMSAFLLLMISKERSDLKVLEMQQSLIESEVRFQRIVETSVEGILIFNEKYEITFANQNMASSLGHTVEEMIGMSYVSLFPEDLLDIYRQQKSLRKKGDDSVYEVCLLTKNKERHWFLVSAKALIDEYGRFEGSFAMLTDINDRKEMELLLAESNRLLTELSNTDGLTGIANRRNFDMTLEREYSRLSRTNSYLSVIMLDIDHFKEYNDHYGHIAGDECLRQIGKVLADCISRSVDLAARYGGEEFACILPDTDVHAAVKIADKIRKTIRDLKIEHKKSPVCEYVTASLGVATVRYERDRSVEEIVAIADRLMYKAKLSGRNRIEYAEA